MQKKHIMNTKEGEEHYSICDPELYQQDWYARMYGSQEDSYWARLCKEFADSLSFQGETVLDLGSGAGFDCFLAVRAVGKTGFVIGVDMTPDMVSKARKNAERSGFKNIDFRLGEIEHLPVADNTVDVIVSNCVINLSPEKEKVFLDAYRVLKSGGRLAISDVVATAKLPEKIKKDMALYSGCMAGASTIDELTSMLKKAGFKNIKISPKGESKEFIKTWAPGRNIEDYVVSAAIEAVKP